MRVTVKLRRIAERHKPSPWGSVADSNAPLTVTDEEVTNPQIARLLKTFSEGFDSSKK